jgi:hypothetical protein
MKFFTSSVNESVEGDINSNNDLDNVQSILAQISRAIPHFLYKTARIIRLSSSHRFSSCLAKFSNESSPVTHNQLKPT